MAILETRTPVAKSSALFIIEMIRNRVSVDLKLVASD